MIEFYEGNGTPIKSLKIGRNNPCKCGSGKKAKICCGTETRYFVKEKKQQKPTCEDSMDMPIQDQDKESLITT